jgi:GH43 family beta-xylosidase
MSVIFFAAGFFTSPSNTYYVAPQQLDSKGVIKGHTHVVIQEVNGKRAFKTEQVKISLLLVVTEV